MRNALKILFFLPVLMAGLGLILGSRVTAQTFTTLYNFTGGADEAGPGAGLILSGNTLYGTASGIGGSGYASSSHGTVFAVNTNGTGFNVLHTFTATVSPEYTNGDGAYPNGGIVLSGNTLYGTANEGGSADNGTVFAVNTNGTGFTNLHNFTTLSAPFPDGGTNRDGAYPASGLILSGNILYGTAEYGGSADNGTVFAVNTDGSGFTILHSFTALSPNYYTATYTNSDGAYPFAGLILSGNTLYGTTENGGSADNGTVFAVNTDGTGFRTLHNFTTLSASYENIFY